MSRLDALHDFVARLPSTNWIRFVGSILIGGTAVVVWALLLFEVDINEVFIAEWLTFLAAIEGISYRQFKVKRETHQKFADDDA